MIDKKLLRQAAEDVDIFQEDLSREYDMIVRSRQVSRLRRWAMAACVVMTLGISLTLYIYDTPTQQFPLAQNAQPTAVHIVPSSAPSSHVCITTVDDKSSQSSNLTSQSSASDSEHQGNEMTGDNETVSTERATTVKTSERTDILQPSRQTEKSIRIEESPADTPSQPASTDNSIHTSVDASTELLFAILAEVDARSVAQQEATLRLQRAVLEEINTYATSKTDIIELTL